MRTSSTPRPPKLRQRGIKKKSIRLWCIVAGAIISVSIFNIWRHHSRCSTSTAISIGEFTSRGITPLSDNMVAPKRKLVYIFPETHHTEVMGELKHVLIDGVERSSHLQLTEDPDHPEACWAVEFHRAAKDLVQAVRKSSMRRGKRMKELSQSESESLVTADKTQRQSTSSTSSGWDLFLIDYSDD